MRKYTLQSVSVVTSIMASFLFFAHAAAQGEGRIKKVNIPNEPVEIFNLRVNGQAVDFGRNFKMDEYWIDKVEVDVKNITDKAILSLRIALYVRVNDTEELFANFGFIHKKRIAPGETAKISTDAGINSKIKAKIGESGKSVYYDQAEMRVDRVTFEDGTIWAQGTVYGPDPDDPKKLKKVSDPPANTSQATSRVRFARAGFKIDDTFPKCGKAQKWSSITCQNIVEMCSTLVFTTDQFKSGDYSTKEVIEACEPSECGVERYKKAETCYSLGE